jgi:glyoxylase-like metal-dependent hydrolase (beta-lactamase superfamily II)/rhodanese-related sulfurtransferase
MLFRQLLDPETSTWTYLLADADSREAVLIDPVREQLARDLELLEQLELRLLYSLETHVHADHVTGGGGLRERLGCRIGLGSAAGVVTADLQLGDGERVRFGRHALEVLATPGHTRGCVTYLCREEGMAFTGDALLIRGCGRTDFQQGDARALYRSVRERIFALPDATRLYPGHDYRGRTVTTVGEEKRFNPRLGGSRGLAEFVALMEGLKLAYPKRIDEAVPANLCAGVTDPEPAEPSPRAEDAWAPLLRTRSGVPALGSDWVAAHARELRLVDVREAAEFRGSLGHLAGAELVPLAGLEGAARGWDRAAPILTVCTYGTRSGKAAQLLAGLGFSRVASLHGGLVRWTREGRPVVERRDEVGSQAADAWLGIDI